LSRRRQSGHRLALIGLLATALAAGCAHYAPTPAARTASFQPFAANTVGPEGLRDYVLQRVAILFWGADQLTLTPEQPSPTGPQVGFKFSPQGPFGYGNATAIDARGYFLTAAHCVGRSPVYVIWREGKPGAVRTVLLPARVVFRGDPAGKGTDLAVLRVGQALDRAFSWADRYAAGDPVVSAGQNADRSGIPNLAAVLLGGSLIGSTPHPEANPPRTTLFHTTPIHPGDSGGPLVAPDGRLLAINVAYAEGYEFLPPFHIVHATAHRPDLSWLRQVIDQDWSRRPN